MARPFVKLSDSFSILRDKVNTVSYNVGDPDNLNTYLDSDVVQAINEIENVFDASSGEILYPTGVAGETQTRLLISTAQNSGTDVQINVGANFNVDAAGDINLDAGGANINFLDDSVNRFAYTLGTTNVLAVTGAYDINVAGLYDLNATGVVNITSGGNYTTTVTGDVLFDASGDITLDAGDNNFVVKGNGTTRFDYSLGNTNNITVTGDHNLSVSDSASLITTNGYLEDIGGLMRTEVGSTKHTFVTGAMVDSADSYSLSTTDNISQTSSHGSITQSAATGITLDAGGDIVLDADDGDIDFKNGGATHFAFGLGATNTLDVTGNLTNTVSGNYSDSANGTYHVGSTGNMDVRTYGTYALQSNGTLTTTSASQTHNVTGTHTTDVSSNATRTVGGNLSDSADGTYHIGATGNTDIRTRGTFNTNSLGQTHTVGGNYSIDASGDISLDADNGNIDFKDAGATKFAFGMGTTQTLDITQSFKQTTGSNWTDSASGARYINSTGALASTASSITATSRGAQTLRANGGLFTIVASDDVNVTAGGNQFRLKNNSGDRFVYNFGTNQEIDVTGNLTYDVEGDIVLDAGGGDIDLKDGTDVRFAYGLGASNTLDVTGNLTQTVSGNFSDSANGTYHIGATGNTDITTGGTFSTTSLSQTHAVTGNVTVTVSGDHSDSADGTRDISATDGINIDTRGPMTNTAGGAFNLATEGSFGITADGQITVTGDQDITLSAGGKDIVFKDSSSERIRFNLDSDQVLEFTNSLVIDADLDITLEANGKQVNLNDGTQNNFVFNLGSNQEIDVVGNLTFDVNGDIILDANGADNILRDNGSEYGRFTNSGTNLFIKSGNNTDALQFTANTAVFHKALFTDSALGTDADNVAGGINELETVLRGSNGVYTLETTAQNVRDAINELSRELYDSGASFTGLSGTNFQDAIEELRVELGNHTSLTTSTTTSAVAAINELDAEIGDSDISSIASINSTVKGALRQLHNEVGTLSLTVRDSEGGVTTTVTDLTTAVNFLDERLDIIEGWTNQDVQTSASPTFSQVTASEVNYGSNFTLDIEGDINLDANGGDIYLKDNGTQFGRFVNSSNHLDIYSGTTLAIEMDASRVEIHGRAFFVDSALDTVADNVAGAINELHTDIVNNDSDIAELDSRVGKLYNLDSSTAGGFFSTASINNDSIVNALNELASRAVLIYDENGTLLN